MTQTYSGHVSAILDVPVIHHLDLPSSTTRRLVATGGLLLILLLCCFLFFYRLGDRGLTSSHEARAAQDAQSILLDHSWGLPRLFDRKVELQKPPLYYWLVAATAAACGGNVDAWSVRLPAAVAALCGVASLYFLAVWRGRALAGFLAATMAATAIHFTWLARTGRIDMVLAFTVSAALACFYMGQRRRQEQHGKCAWCWFFGAYLAAALSILLKGPVGLVLPAVAVLAYLLVEKELPSLRQVRAWLRLFHALGIWWGVPLVLAIALPWYVWANDRTNGDLFWVFVWKHNLERGLGDGSLRTHPWWFYGPRLAFDLLPWSVLLPVALWIFARRREFRSDPEARFGLTWLMSGLVVLSCASFKRADYLLPLYSGAALFLGCLAERWYRAVNRQKLVAVLFGLVLCAFPAGWVSYASALSARDGETAGIKHFAAEIRRRAPAPQLVLFFRTEVHALAFHVGRPLDTLLEWENLDVWASRPQIYHVVMPASYAREWRQRMKSGRLEEITRSSILAGAYHDDPLVLLRTAPNAGSATP